MAQMILVWRDTLLPRSQTFILAQGEATRRHQVRYGGLESDPHGLELPLGRAEVAFSGRLGRLQKVLFRETGRSQRVEELVRAARPDLIHAHFLYDAAHILPICRRLSFPLIATCHGWAVRTRHRGLVSRAFVRRQETLWQTARRIICVSESIRRRVLAMGCPAERAVTHYIGCDTRFFAPSAEPRPAPAPIVAFVGRLVSIKGCGQLISAVAEARRHHPAIRLEIAGWGPDERELRAQAQAALGGSCAFLGALDRRGVRELLARARCLCVPSAVGEDGTEEALGQVFLEAQSMGIPAISTRLGGIPEAIRDKVTGLLCDSGSLPQLVEAITAVCINDGLWSAMAAAARPHVLRNFDLDRQTSQLETIYDEVIAEGGRP